MTTDPDLDVRVNYFPLKLAIRPRDVLTAHDGQLNLPSRKSLRVEPGRRDRAVPDGLVSHVLGLEDEAAASVVEKASAVDEVLPVLGLVV